MLDMRRHIARVSGSVTEQQVCGIRTNQELRSVESELTKN
jgi:hypothetical protein